MQIHFIVHEVFEAPGAYLRWAQARGYGISWSRGNDVGALPSGRGCMRFRHWCAISMTATRWRWP